MQNRKAFIQMFRSFTAITVSVNGRTRMGNQLQTGRTRWNIGARQKKLVKAIASERHKPMYQKMQQPMRA